MDTFTVKEVARLSGVTVRALHHYDAIGLLKPATVGANGYRYYGREDLLRLQQILFHRELGFSLCEIGQTLDATGFDRTAALRAHREQLLATARRARALIRTIDQTLMALNGDAPMKEKAMYRGFDPAREAQFEDELVAAHGAPMRAHIDHAKAGMEGWSQRDFDTMQAEAEAIEAGMAEALSAGFPVSSAPVAALMRRQHAWVVRSWSRDAPAEAFAGLGRMYMEHPEFRARYESRQAGLTEYMAAAMTLFAGTVLGAERAEERA